MPDVLQTLLRLRRLAVDQARRDLGACLRHEAETADKAKDIAAAIDRETDVVCRTDGEDRMVDNFAAWLKRTRAEQDAAAEALLAAETRTQEARAVLSVGRAAV